MPNAEASSKAVTGTTPPERWPWRHGRRGEVLVVALLAGLFATALVLIGTTVYIGSLRQDEAQQAHEQLIVSANLKSLERQIGGNVADYANWDDAVEHLVLNSDTDWATRNVGPTVDATLGYELSLVLNQDGQRQLRAGGWYDRHQPCSRSVRSRPGPVRRAGSGRRADRERAGRGGARRGGRSGHRCRQCRRPGRGLRPLASAGAAGRSPVRQAPGSGLVEADRG